MTIKTKKILLLPNLSITACSPNGIADLDHREQNTVSQTAKEATLIIPVKFRKTRRLELPKNLGKMAEITRKVKKKHNFPKLCTAFLVHIDRKKTKTIKLNITHELKKNKCNHIYQH